MILSCGVRSALSCFSFFLITGRVFRFVCVFWWRFPARAFLFSFGCVRFALMFLGFRHPGATFFIFSSSRFVRFALLLFSFSPVPWTCVSNCFFRLLSLWSARFLCSFRPASFCLFFVCFRCMLPFCRARFTFTLFGWVVFGGRGCAFIAPRAYASFPLPSRGVRFASLCFLPDCVFYPAGSICRGAKIRCSRSLYASLKG